MKIKDFNAETRRTRRTQSDVKANFSPRPSASPRRCVEKPFCQLRDVRPHPDPLPQERIPRTNTRIAPLNRSSRRESALTLFGIRWSGLTSAATRFMGREQQCATDEISNGVRSANRSAMISPLPGERAGARAVVILSWVELTILTPAFSLQPSAFSLPATEWRSSSPSSCSAW